MKLPGNVLAIDLTRADLSCLGEGAFLILIFAAR